MANPAYARFAQGCARRIVLGTGRPTSRLGRPQPTTWPTQRRYFPADPRRATKAESAANSGVRADF